MGLGNIESDFKIESCFEISELEGSVWYYICLKFFYFCIYFKYKSDLFKLGLIFKVFVIFEWLEF